MAAVVPTAIQKPWMPIESLAANLGIQAKLPLILTNGKPDA